MSTTMTQQADISALGNLQSADNLDMSLYTEEPRSSFRLPPAGEYTLRAPDSFPAEAFGKSQASGALTARVDPTIVGGEFDGFQLRFIKVSAKPYDTKSGARISQAGLYLKKFGVTDIPGDPQGIANAIAATAGKTYTAYLDWEARKGMDFEVKGMRKFPLNSDGTYQSWVEHPTMLAEDGSKLKVRAHLTVRW